MGSSLTSLLPLSRAQFSSRSLRMVKEDVSLDARPPSYVSPPPSVSLYFYSLLPWCFFFFFLRFSFSAPWGRFSLLVLYFAGSLALPGRQAQEFLRRTVPRARRPRRVSRWILGEPGGRHSKFWESLVSAQVEWLNRGFSFCCVPLLRCFFFNFRFLPPPSRRPHQ